MLKLANQGGAASGTIVSVDQGNAEIPIGSITETGGKLSLALPTIGASYEGALKGGEIVGTWTQGPGSLPLTFKRKQRSAPVIAGAPPDNLSGGAVVFYIDVRYTDGRHNALTT